MLVLIKIILQGWQIIWLKGRFFIRRFRDPIRVPRISNRVSRIREIGSLQIHTGYQTFSLKKKTLLKGHFEKTTFGG